ncbi:hypothetical protein ArsFIN_21330 [Arsenophonus nasoniae]|uniref:Uncharacterized protein n=1 Tax=Arsenophonus nasoniae TaxID=638 RepID=A0A4P7KU30_9GAMM|nr:hypothetical protein ArsFIN_21330 [Arsenophonus nasoniae]
MPLNTDLRAHNLELDIEIANAKVGPWLQRVAHQRIHGTTLEKPADRFVMVNKFCRRSKRHFLVHDIFDVALNNQSLNGVDNNCKTEYNFQLHRQQIDDS